jgi:hypothetical protein
MSDGDLTQTPDNIPDIRTCRALDLGQQDLAECRCTGPNDCVYALPFAYSYLCQHPRLHEILDATQQSMIAARAQSHMG